MGFQPTLRLVRCFCILILLRIIPYTHAKSSKCPESSALDPRMVVDDYNFTANMNASRYSDYQYIVMESGVFGFDSRDELLQMPGDAQALVYVPHQNDPNEYRYLSLVSGPGLWLWDPQGSNSSVTAEASFNVTFTMSVYGGNTTKGRGGASPNNGLAFLVLPALSPQDTEANVSLREMLSLHTDGSLAFSEADHLIRLNDNNASVEIGLVHFQPRRRFRPGGYRVLAVSITITEPTASPNYTVWIDYDSTSHRMAVYVAAGEDKTKPLGPIASMEQVTFADVAYSIAEFGVFSSVGQFLQIHTWSFWVRGLPNYDYGAQLAKEAKVRKLEIIVTVAGTVVVAAAVGVAWYFRSKQRKWKKEQEKLARAMQRLPGVPTQVDFADIRKATANFHETTKLGRGGFSSVYRCRLPAAASRTTGQAMEVAVKKFTREVQERRYEDFLAEVSIINRLRHKNIVPLVGWSYHKGVPLLIYDYMRNGSLDQHLFRKGSTGQQHTEDTAIRQWHTRHSIVQDVATGLHYVHHEHEPMVLHRDIKASNIMLDSNFHARLGDFGIASTVSADRSSVTGIAGTWGYISPEYAMSHRATRQTDIYAFGVLVLELVTGRKWDVQLQPDDDHITDWVWRLHGEGRLLEAVDGVLAEEVQKVDADGEAEAERLLLLGLACTNPNPSSRPSMAEAVQVITKLVPPPEVPPEKPTFVWPPEDWRSLDTDCSTTVSNLDRSWGSTVELVQVGLEERQPVAQSTVSTSM